MSKLYSSGEWDKARLRLVLPGLRDDGRGEVPMPGTPSHHIINFTINSCSTRDLYRHFSTAFRTSRDQKLPNSRVFQNSHFYRATARNAMHCTAMNFRPSIRLSVCLSVCQMRDLWQTESNLCPHFYTIWKSIHPSFLIGRTVGGATPSTWNFQPNWPR